MGRLRALLHVATPDATRNATAQQTPDSPLLHVAPPRECNTQQLDALPGPAAEARILLQRLVQSEPAHWTPQDVVDAEASIARDPAGWLGTLVYILDRQERPVY